MRKEDRACVGFTLIELMTVIAIMGVLAGLVLAGSFTLKSSGRRKRAAVESSTILVAIKAYRVEYGKWPGMNETPDSFNDRGTPDDPLDDIITFNENNERVFRCLRPGYSQNPRDILFVEEETFSLDNSGTVLTPWGAMEWYLPGGENNHLNCYEITIDLDYPASGGRGVRVTYKVPNESQPREAGFDENDVDEDSG